MLGEVVSLAEVLHDLVHFLDAVPFTREVVVLDKSYLSDVLDAEG